MDEWGSTVVYMHTEKRNCQNCKNEFHIESEDFLFYEKIHVPPPTFCPECRMIRRMMWRNVRSLFRRECGLCKKTLISMYKDDGAPVYCIECWNSDTWNPFATGREYDFSTPFFDQLRDLLKVAPRSYQYRSGNVINSDFSNYTVDNKNAYLSYSVISNEDILYCDTVDKSKNTVDSYTSQKLDGCSWNIDCDGNYNMHYGVKAQNCIDSYFLFDCVNCQNCCLSSNLRNQQYVFNNTKLSKEEYQEALKNLQLETHSGLQQAKNLFKNLIQKVAIHRFAQIYSSQGATGDYIGNSKNIKDSFDIQHSENVAYSVRVPMNVKDSYDLQGVGINAELIYESLAASVNTYKDFFCYITLSCKECEYSLILRNCSDCFGCVGLTNAQYCILNKQYTKEEYFSMIEKIKAHMCEMPYVDAHGRMYSYGEFFPYDLSFFGYNETNAHDNFTISKQEALSKGYNWYEREKREYIPTLLSKDIPENIHDITDTILSETIECINKGNPNYQCTQAFKVVPEELRFYRSKNIPIPHTCPNCRHYERVTYRNPMKLYSRSCSCAEETHQHETVCLNQFKSTYAPDRPEKVYCESCYQKSVL